MVSLRRRYQWGIAYGMGLALSILAPWYFGTTTLGPPVAVGHETVAKAVRLAHIEFPHDQVLRVDPSTWSGMPSFQVTLHTTQGVLQMLVNMRGLWTIEVPSTTFHAPGNSSHHPLSSTQLALKTVGGGHVVSTSTDDRTHTESIVVLMSNGRDARVVVDRQTDTVVRVTLNIHDR